MPANSCQTFIQARSEFFGVFFALFLHPQKPKKVHATGLAGAADERSSESASNVRLCYCVWARKGSEDMQPETVLRFLLSVETAILVVCVLVHYLAILSIA